MQTGKYKGKQEKLETARSVREAYHVWLYCKQQCRQYKSQVRPVNKSVATETRDRVTACTQIKYACGHRDNITDSPSITRGAHAPTTSATTQAAKALQRVRTAKRGPSECFFKWMVAKQHALQGSSRHRPGPVARRCAAIRRTSYPPRRPRKCG